MIGCMAPPHAYWDPCLHPGVSSRLREPLRLQIVVLQRLRTHVPARDRRPATVTSRLDWLPGTRVPLRWSSTIAWRTQRAASGPRVASFYWVLVPGQSTKLVWRASEAAHQPVCSAMLASTSPVSSSIAPPFAAQRKATSFPLLVLLTSSSVKANYSSAFSCHLF